LFIGDEEELNSIYEKAILADEKQSADMIIQTQMTITKVSHTMKSAKGKAIGKNNKTNISTLPIKKINLKTSKMKYVNLFHYYLFVFLLFFHNL
jgi:hypothetical protein